MATSQKNVDLFRRINEGYLHKVGADGRYNRDRIAEQLGITLDKRGGLSDEKRKRFQAAVEGELGFKLPSGVQIDPAANVNENEGVGEWARDWRTYAAIGAGATGLGALGIGPLAGVMGGSGAASGAGAENAAGVYTTPAFAGAMGPGAAAGASGAAGAAGIVAKAGGALKTSDIARDIIKAGGSALGEYANASAHNRGVQADCDLENAKLKQEAERKYNEAMLAREQEGRESRRAAYTDAMRAA